MEGTHLQKHTVLYRPVILVLLCALLVCCVGTALFDLRAFYFTAAVSALALIGCLIALRRARKEVDRFIAQVGDAISALQTETLMEFPLPIVAAMDGEITWYNRRAGEDVFSSEEWHARPVSQLIGEDKPVKKPFSITRGEKRYTIYPVSQEKEAQLVLYYLIDDTELKNLAAEYERSRPAIFMISVDNYGELLQYGKESGRSQVLTQVERRIEEFAAQNNALLIKTERDRYVAVIEEKYMDALVEQRFPLLDRVRMLSVNNDNLSVTLSVGVARRCTGYPEGEKIARQALDMAQGRGGDQVALRTSSGYDFFGGVSKGVERRTKVKTRIIATALRELILSSDCVFLMGHKYADFDCLGASVGLLRAVRQMGKKGVVAISRTRNLVSGLLNHLEQSGYADSFYNPADALEMLRECENPLLIIVDTHLENVLESPEIYRACRNVVVIDHHRRMVGYIENGVIFYHEPYASSASEMVTELIQYFGEDVTIGRPEAEALLAGIMLDTKNFVLRTGVRTFEAAAYLRRQGADTVEVRKLFSSTIVDYQERSRLVAGAEIYRGCAIAQTDSLSPDIKVIAAQAADELLNISGVDASFVLFEFGDGISISARSMGRINVQVIMEALGGGGHQTMAAAQLDHTTLEAARQKLLEAIESQRAAS